jgi:two-component system OmpR family response regulator
MYPQGTHILIIASNASQRRISERMLSDEGFSVTAVSEGFAAVRAAGARRYDLAVIALQLPGCLDGQTTLRHLRARQPALKALFTGAVGERPFWSERDREDFIAAPFNRRELLGCVFELLERDAAGPRFGRLGRSRAG